MGFKRYAQAVDCICPVAIKLCQTEIHAPGHDTWGVLTCDVCGEQFAIGPSRTYGSRNSEQDCVRQLEDVLARDHKNGHLHESHYEFPD